MKKVIVNADDFGLSISCTKAIVDAFEKKIITDTTMVANGNAESMVFVADLLQHGHDIEQCIGIHFNLTEGYPISEKIKKCERIVNKSTGLFCNSFPYIRSYLMPLTGEEKEAIRLELCAQVDVLRKLGINITHADSHQHIHFNPNIIPLIDEVCAMYNITKLLIYKNVSNDRFLIKMYRYVFNKHIKHKYCTATWFGNAVEYKTVRDGISEIMVHPDYDKNHNLINRIKKIKENGSICNIGNLLLYDLKILEPEKYETINYRLLKE